MYTLLLVGQPAEPPKDPNCGGNTKQMVECADRLFLRVDRDLNVVWEEVTVSLREKDRTSDDGREPRLDIARTAQQAWLAYRDAQCAADADREARGGSVYPLHYIGCRTDMTLERITQLRRNLGQN